MPASGYIFGTVPTPPTLPSQRLGGGSGGVSGTGRGVSVPANIYKAVAEASQKVGVSFAYLMTKASTESSFNPNAQAKTSSASGLYQFIERTWLDMVDKHGAQYGLGTYADAITRRADGTPVVANRTLRKEILDLRKDPRVSALMAAEYAGENKRYLESKLGRSVTDTDLYLAHFLGAGGALRFLSAMDSNASTRAAAVMPEAASANRGVFYASSTGRALSLQAVYDRFERKFDNAPLYVADGATPIAEPGMMDATWHSDAARPDAARPASDGAIPNMYLISALETPVENDESEPSHAISALHATGRYLAAPGAVPYGGSLYRGLA
jgi:hypothetical protein